MWPKISYLTCSPLSQLFLLLPLLCLGVISVFVSKLEIASAVHVLVGVKRDRSDVELKAMVTDGSKPLP